MSSKLMIEAAQMRDLLLIRPLLQELFEAMVDTEGCDLAKSLENCRSFIGDPAQYLLVARQGNDVLGFINFSTRKTLLHPAPSGLIDELVVSEKYRRAGIGKLLIQAAVDKCRNLGCCEVEVSTEKTNTKARRFYRTCGFEEDAVLLERDLDDSSNGSR
jgi:ribosomal protein S18 acetylase RimI-like enzyme